LDIFETEVQDFLVVENRNKPSIQFYDFKHNKITREVLLETEGPNGIGKSRGVFVKNFDSLYVLSPFHYSIYLINNEGKVLDKYQWLNSTAEIKSSSMAGIYSTSPAILLEDQLHIFAVPETGYKKKVTFESGNVNLTLNLRSKEVSLNYNYPETYRKRMFGNLFLKIDRTKTATNNILYSFGADNLIYETNYHDINRSYFAGSSYFDEAIPLQNLDNADDHQMLTGYYSGIKYDRYRKLYYRLAVHPIDLVNVQNQRNHLKDKQLSVIVLDENFKIVGETLLPTKRHLYTTWFVGEAGLYISNHNRSNSLIGENVLSFTIYEPALLP